VPDAENFKGQKEFVFFQAIKVLIPIRETISPEQKNKTE